MLSCIVALPTFILINICEIKYAHYDFEVKKYTVKFNSGESVYLTKSSYKAVINNVKKRGVHVEKSK